MMLRAALFGAAVLAEVESGIAPGDDQLGGPQFQRCDKDIYGGYCIGRQNCEWKVVSAYCDNMDDICCTDKYTEGGSNDEAPISGDAITEEERIFHTEKLEAELAAAKNGADQLGALHDKNCVDYPYDAPSNSLFWQCNHSGLWSLGYCQTFVSAAKEYCPKTCGYCEADPTEWAQGNCLAFRATKDCSGNWQPTEPEADRGCHTIIKSGMSGYCECKAVHTTRRVNNKDCGTRAKEWTCYEACGIPPTSAPVPTTEPTVFVPYVPQKCRDHINWCLIKGVKSSSAEDWWGEMVLTIGVEWWDATFEDFQRWYWCTGNSVCKGVTHPANCSSPPCDGCKWDMVDDEKKKMPMKVLRSKM